MKYLHCSESHPNVSFLLHKFHLFCVHPSSGYLMERKIEVHKNMTLGEVIERSYKVSDVHFIITILLICCASVVQQFSVSVSIMRDYFCYECPGPGAGEVWCATGAVSVSEV